MLGLILVGGGRRAAPPAGAGADAVTGQLRARRPHRARLGLARRHSRETGTYCTRHRTILPAFQPVYFPLLVILSEREGLESTFQPSAVRIDNTACKSRGKLKTKFLT